ncbi:amidohydrolase family protein [Singulisphaera acidiphila]|uniref:Amidohydrolase, imidazolonepropionase n=1 Tax=Singulisphaera acidiphila (strain ATCC BAA-1392 / DSM 18658 / VKM B-2454 / MOB10) TaxID=886293 RepID=L0DDB7_SINAD|nr:amidohydrolase family protein [Singulisphaera acidiphila]AGA26845.1 amidohydrolase, imidazolonepropionase [Singulisphaera acidiphila DSM 18658]
MKITSIARLSAMLWGFSLLPATAAEHVVAFTHVRLVDGKGGPPINEAVVVIEGNRIVTVGPSGTAIPEGAEIRDSHGLTMIPGLVSDHSHIGQVGGTSTGAENYTRTRIEAELRQYRDYGVTTVTALGNNGPLFETIRAEAHAGRTDGADLFGVDRGVGVPDGAPPQAMVKLGPDQLFRPRNAVEARAAITAMAERKTDLIKIWLDDFAGGVPAKMSPEVYNAVIDEAHRRGIRVAAHIHDLADAKAIVAAGADIIAHGVRDQPVDPVFIDAMKAQGVWYVATLSLDDATFAWADQAPWTQTPFAKAALSPELARQFADPAWRSKVLADPKTAAARASLAMNLRNLKTLHDAGVKIGFGTDSGATPLRVAGIAEHRELALMVEAGLTPQQALKIATANAADALRLTDRGRIAPGLRADFIVLDADPSRAIGNSQSIREVWLRGRVFPRVK